MDGAALSREERLRRVRELFYKAVVISQAHKQVLADGKGGAWAEEYFRPLGRTGFAPEQERVPGGDVKGWSNAIT